MATKGKKEAESTVTVDYPKRWVFDEGSKGDATWVDGELVDGRFVRFDQGRTEFGVKPIVILEVDGVERSLWLLHDALFNRVRDELQRRSMPELVLGERIAIRKHPDKTRSKNDRSYQGYDVMFLEAPAPDVERLFNLTGSPPREPAEPKKESEPTPTLSASADPDADIPF